MFRLLVPASILTVLVIIGSILIPIALLSIIILTLSSILSGLMVTFLVR